MKRAGRRMRLPDFRPGKTLHFTIFATVPGGQPPGKGRKAKKRVSAVPDRVVEVDGYVTTGLYPDGRLGEVFLRLGKPGGAFAVFDQWAIAFSMALQHGAGVDALCGKFVGSRFEPSGPTSVPGIPRCTSVLDLACRWLLARYGAEARAASVKGGSGKEEAA